MSTKKDFICIVCPASCRLTVTEENGSVAVTGNTCKRGEDFGKAEFSNPTRMLTTTIAIENAPHPRLPVISTAEIPKSKLNEALAQVYQTKVKSPIKCGDVIIKNICNTGADIVASRTM